MGDLQPMSEPFARDLNSLTHHQLEGGIEQAGDLVHLGYVADRIPQLGRADPRWLAVYVHRRNQPDLVAGEAATQRFTLMSAVKPFLLLYLLHHLGSSAVRKRVGVAPSMAAFHSLDQLIADGGRPRNPMINSGAITLAGALPGQDGSQCCQILCRWLNQAAGCQLQLDEATLASVRALKNDRNRAIALYLKESGYLEDIEIAIDTYNQICCLAGTVADLAKLGALLAFEADATNSGATDLGVTDLGVTDFGAIARSHRQLVNAVMLTCGLYEASSEFAIRIGLPVKSGISGALLAVVPNQGAIACYSPALDTTGNPLAALSLVEYLSHNLGLSLFS